MSVSKKMKLFDDREKHDDFHKEYNDDSNAVSWILSSIVLFGIVISCLWYLIDSATA